MQTNYANPLQYLTLIFVLMLGSCGGGGGGGTTTPAVQLGTVAALFPSNGANWNDYVSGSNWRTAADAACNAASDTACLHGGERRVVAATGQTSCAGLTAADDLGAFNWVCDIGIDHVATDSVRMVSTGLTYGKSLSDLIDFGTHSFKDNKVTVYVNGNAWGVTPSSTWWTNPVSVKNTGGSLTTASTIYLVTSNPAAAWILGADKVALVIKPGVTITGPGTNTLVISAVSHNYLWLEGSLNASGDSTGVDFAVVYFSVLRNLTANNAASNGVNLNGATNNTLLGVTAANNGTGVYLSASNNMLLGVTAANNDSYGVYLTHASNNTFSGVTAANNFYGVYLDSASNNNTFAGITATNNSNGVSLDGTSSNNTFAGVTAANNTYGVYLGSASNNTLSNVTAANNSDGVSLASASNNTLSNVTAANNYYGVSLNSVLNNTFTGLLEIGSNATDCKVSGGTNPGLVDSTCANNGSSNAVLTTGITVANSFAGKVTNNDVANGSDTLGTATFPTSPATFDWVRFDNIYRSWGKDGSAFPNTNQAGQWTTGTGRIWDWSLRAADTVDRGVLSLPTGNDTLTQIWSGTPVSNDNAGCNTMVAGALWNGSACQTTFLKNAVEIPTDGVGNHNGLCETGETCLYTPNIGSYQGHGNLVSAGTFTPGTLSNISLMKFASNGR